MITLKELSPSIVEVAREGVSTAYLLAREDYAGIAGVQNEDTRWRLVKSLAKAKRTKQKETP